MRISRLRAVPVLLLAVWRLAPAQTAAGGSHNLTPIRVGPVYTPEKPDRNVEVVVDLAPTTDLKQKIAYDELKSAYTLIEDGKPGAQADEVKA
jgi:hypothetical protein